MWTPDHNTICEPFVNCYQKFGNANCLKHFSSLELGGPNRFRHENVPEHEASKLHADFGMEVELEGPAQLQWTGTQFLCQAFLLQLRPCGWMGTIPQVQSLVKSLVKRVEQGHGFGISSVLRCPHFWPYSVCMLIIVIY